MSMLLKVANNAYYNRIPPNSAYAKQAVSKLAAFNLNRTPMQLPNKPSKGFGGKVFSLGKTLIDKNWAFNTASSIYSIGQRALNTNFNTMSPSLGG